MIGRLGYVAGLIPGSGQMKPPPPLFPPPPPLKPRGSRQGEATRPGGGTSVYGLQHWAGN